MAEAGDRLTESLRFAEVLDRLNVISDGIDELNARLSNVEEQVASLSEEQSTQNTRTSTTLSTLANGLLSVRQID